MPYLDHQQIDQRLDVIAQHPSNAVQVFVFPNPCIDPPLAALRCRYLRIETNRTSDSALEKTKYFVIGGIHAREMPPPESILFFVETLLDAYAGDTPFVAGSYSLPAADVKRLVDQSVFFVAPLVNPAGRRHVETRNPMWRKNRAPTPDQSFPGTDCNRNFDIVWDFFVTFDRRATVNADGRGMEMSIQYHGSAAASENETKNIQWLIDTERPQVFFDMHTFHGCFGHVFALDTPTADPALRAQTHSDTTFDGKRDGRSGAVYAEFIDANRLARHDQVAKEAGAAVLKAHNRAYTTGPILSLLPPNYNAVPGCSIDYHFTRNPDRYLAFTMEAGFDADGRFAPDHATQFPTVRDEIAAAIVGACFEVAKNGLGQPGAAGGGGGGGGSGGGSGGGGGLFALFWRLLRSFAKWLWTVLRRLLFGYAPPVVLPPAAPAGAAVPPATGAHVMRLDRYYARGGERMRAVLMDNSIDFTQCDPRWIRIEHVFQWSSGGVHGLIMTVVNMPTILGPRVLEYTLPPVNPPDPRGVPAGAYKVTFLYHPRAWFCDAERDLGLH